MKKSVITVKESNGPSTSSVNGMRRELMRLPNSNQSDKSNQYNAQDNDDFISTESDRQQLLIRYCLNTYSALFLFCPSFCSISVLLLASLEIVRLA